MANNVLPEQNITTAEIKQTLNSNGGDVNDDLTSFFSNSANISMWSKYKPVINNSLFYTLDEWKNWAYKGLNDDCGITIPRSGTIESVRPYLEQNGALWTYTPPQGGNTEPMRLGDFRLYNPKATNPIGRLHTNGYSEGGDINIDGEVEFNIEVNSVSQYNLTYGDIEFNGTPLTDWYFGIYAWKDTSWKYKTNNVTLGQEYNFSVKIPLTTGKWNVVPILSSVAQTGTGNQGTIIGANIAPMTFEIISTKHKYLIEITGIWDVVNRKVRNIVLKITNNSGASGVLKGISVVMVGIDRNNEEYEVSKKTWYKNNSNNEYTLGSNASLITNVGDFEDLTISNNNYDDYGIKASFTVGSDSYTLTLNVYGLEQEGDEVPE